MTLATVPEAIREMAWNIGYEYPDRAWLLSDYDVWTPNPHYVGPPQPHPESDPDDFDVDVPPTRAPALLDPDWDDEIPF